MLTLGPGSICDVCAEEFSPQCIPHSIPCGHVLCSTCCHKIVEKTLPRFKPVCPFCRENFTSDDVRLIRIDFSASGYTIPWRRGGKHEAHDARDHSPHREDRFPIVEPSYPRSRAESTRRLEDKVAKVAAKKCSVEEVSRLHRELEDWLSQDDSPDDQVSSLYLSAALLKAILMNHFAHSEATKAAKNVESSLKAKLDEMESTITKFDADLKQQQTLYTQKVQECQSLRAEISRFALKSAAPGLSPNRPSSAAPAVLSEHRRQPVSPPGTSTYGAHSTLSRYGASHLRSSSTSIPPASRPVTPARTTTPAVRNETPLQSSRYHATSPVPPLPAKSRAMSVSATSPQKILRSYSDESDREVIHERWIPNPNVAYSPPNGKSMNYPYAFPAGRSRSSGSTNAA